MSIFNIFTKNQTKQAGLPSHGAQQKKRRKTDATNRDITKTLRRRYRAALAKNPKLTLEDFLKDVRDNG